MKMDLELNKIYNEDCLATMKRMPDNFVDLVLTSPPYNMNLRIRNGKYCSRQITKEFSTKYVGFDDNMPIDDFYELHSKILDELIRVSSIVFYNIQIVTGSKRAFFKIIGDKAEYLKDIIVWDKKHGQPAMQSGVLNRRTELILVFEKNNAISRQFKKCNFSRGKLEDIWEIGRGAKVSSEHGASFPVELAQNVIYNFSNGGDKIYDPFMGTGTTAVACLKSRRNYIGSEISENYHKLCLDRIALTRKELKID
jgi:site-specific DNA-methyltransferase (adenine-specific)/modification methylase